MSNKKAKKREPQLNPTTRLVDKVVTMKLPVSYESTILHEYLTYSQGTMLAMFERLGGLLRMLSKDTLLTKSVRQWQSLNLDICRKQLSEITARREILVMGMDIELPEINMPDSYKVEFVASHPIAHDMIKLIKAVSDELRENEALYMGGVIDDSDYEGLKAQAVTVLSGVVDRIAKATFPGKREGGGYNPAELAKYIRNGNRLKFADVPANVRDIIAEYEQVEDEQTAVDVKTSDVAKAPASKEVITKKANPKSNNKVNKAEVVVETETAEETEVA